MNLEVELHVKQVYESQNRAGAYVLLLEEVEGEQREIPIIIGDKEAHSIFCAIHEIPNLRPLTHDLVVSCFNFLGAHLTKVVIYKVKAGVYYSYLYLNKEEQFTRIDARTSDAIALATRMQTPIYIEKEILDAECVEVVMDDETEVIQTTITIEPSIKDLQNKLDKAIEQENYELASVLRDKIAELEKK